MSLTIVNRASTSSTSFSILNLKIYYTSKEQVCEYHSERGGHLKINRKLHATVKEECADFYKVTKCRTDYSKNSLEADKLIKAILIKNFCILHI